MIRASSYLTLPTEDHEQNHARTALAYDQDLLRVARSYVSGSVRRAWQWWKGELNFLVPTIVRQTPKSVALLRYGKTAAYSSALSQQSAAETETEAVTWEELLDAIGHLTDVDSVIVQLDRPHVLIRRVSIPQAALIRAEEVLRLDLERATPLRYGSVYHGSKTAVANAFDVELYHAVAKRDLVDRLHNSLAKYKTKTIRFVAIDQDNVQIPLKTDFSKSVEPDLMHLKRANAALLFGLLLSFTSIVGMEFFLQGKIIEDLDARIGISQSVAVSVRDELDEVIKTQSRKSDVQDRLLLNVAFTQIWDEITRILPNSAWLEELEVNERKVKIIGISKSSAIILPIIEQSKLFENAKFEAPVAYDARLSAERFNIAFNVVQSVNGDNK